LIKLDQTSAFVSPSMGRSTEVRLRMNAEQIIAEIEWLEHLLELSDARPCNVKEEKHKGCEAYTNNPCLQLPTQEWLEHLSKLPDNRLPQTTDLRVKKAIGNGTYPNWAWLLLRKRPAAR